jgi:hypothetical protein
MKKYTGIIYHITCNITGEKYIGSTTRTLPERMYKHKSPNNECVSKQIIDRNDYTYDMIKFCNVDDKNELHQIEQSYIESTECINKLNAHTTPEERLQQKRDSYQRNRTKEIARQNTDVLCECGSIYTKRNRARHFKTLLHQREILRKKEAN